MISVVKYFRQNHFQKKNDFLKKKIRRLVHTKKLRKVKIKVRRLSSESGNFRSSLTDFGEQVWPDLAKMAEFQPDSSGSGQILPFWPDPAESMAGSVQMWWIPAILARSDRF
jgi:hypothetical protein